jgi:hypothetical protein
LISFEAARATFGGLLLVFRLDLLLTVLLGLNLLLTVLLGLNLLLAIRLGLNLLLLGRRLSPGCNVAGRRSIAITGRRSTGITGRRSTAITGWRSTGITGRRSTGIAGRRNIAVTGRRWCNIVRAHLNRLAAIADDAAGIVEDRLGGPVAAGPVRGSA